VAASHAATFSDYTCDTTAAERDLRNTSSTVVIPAVDAGRDAEAQA
jgi:hypothetical protein